MELGDVNPNKSLGSICQRHFVHVIGPLATNNPPSSYNKDFVEPSMKLLGAASLFFFSGVLLVAAHSSTDGMDMSMDGSMSLASGNMVPYLHFTPGDVLWFQGWVPKSPGAMFGACLGLFLLAIVERWIAAMRSLAEAYWRKRCVSPFHMRDEIEWACFF